MHENKLIYLRFFPPPIFYFRHVTSMTIHFGYNKKQVIQALRYHFLTRPEIKILLILINVFTIMSAVLFAFNEIQPLAFLVFSLMWFILLVTIWRILPRSIYRKAHTFQDHFSMQLAEEQVILENNRGAKSWSWKAFSKFVESPYFFHLYFDSRSFFLVPKDAFKSIPEIQEARKLLKEKIKK
jgi:hypothetical protein